MATTTYNSQIAGTQAAAGRGFFGNIAHVLGRVYRTLQIWRLRSEHRRHMVTLDDRLLRDIGISRIEAQIEAAKPFWRA